MNIEIKNIKKIVILEFVNLFQTISRVFIVEFYIDNSCVHSI